MAKPVAGKLGYDSAIDRPTVSLQSGVKRLLTEDDATSPAEHGDDHENGGIDEINVAGLNGTLADTQKIAFKLDGSHVADQRGVNFVQGENVTIELTENGGSNQVDVAISASGGGGLFYVDPPASPHAFNDEFSSGSADLAARGWTFRRVTATAGTMVRVGDVYARREIGTFTTLGPLEYRSSIVNGKLQLQLPVGAVNYLLTKSITALPTTSPNGAMVWSRMQGACGPATGHIGLCCVGFFKDTGGNADFDNSALCGEYYTSSAFKRFFLMNGGSPVTVTDTNTGTSTVSAIPDIKVMTIIGSSSTPSYIGDYATSLSGGYDVSARQINQGGLGSSAGFVHAGIWFNPGDGANSLNGLSPFDYVIDFVRLYAGDLSNKWIGNV